MQPTLVLLAFFSCIAIANAAVSNEADALLLIKADLVDPLGALGSWKPPASPCNWTGVRCNSLGSVEGLDLSHLNISGRLSTGGVGGLPNLARLNLCCNSFSSSLPRTLPHLPTLKEFDVSDNGFVGGFPRGLGASRWLSSLNASGNNFVGPLPGDVANATWLETLDFRGSFFTGPIPKSYGSLRRLKFLGLSGNNLTGELPRELGQLAALERLIIGHNEFEGAIPGEIGNLTSLRYLDMAVGSLRGAIPAELGRLPVLNTVYLYKNSLEGPIPKEIGNISSLAFLDLSDNHISGIIPTELAQLSNLRLLNVMCNRLEGPVPAGIGELPRLQVLELWNNSLTGVLPANLGRSSSLQWLDASSNSLSGRIPPGLCDGGNLTKLILFGNAFSGQVPAGLSACPSLVRVRIHNNRLNGTIPVGLGRLPNLQRLEMATNDLHGPIPVDISQSTSLSFIDLSNNHLQLALPCNILSIPSLQTFIASDNELTGGIPDEFQDSPTLSTLDLSNNRLSGIIPVNLASCERLVSLNLHGNRLTGEIPEAMPTLAILDLSNNLLTGSIPTSLGASMALETFNVSYNNLSGLVPSEGMLRTINPSDLAGNPGLCGGVLPPCGSIKYVSSQSKSNTMASHIQHIIAGWLIGISAVLAIGVAIIFARRLYDRRHAWFDEEELSAWPWRLTAFQRLNFTSADVLACVKECNIIGMGATGVVYKGSLPCHGVPVAVKKLWRSEAGVGSSEADLAGEVSLLGKLRHRNIVRLMGYIHNDTDSMILYEYVPNGSLWEALHGEEIGRMLVDWPSRYEVALGVAQGLAYLHHDCHPPVIHRDVKSNNILLDVNLEARIADFGLAKMMTATTKNNETVSMIAGSYGYIAPEYSYTSKIDQKSDIYSYGVVLMELLTGKRPIEPEFGECQEIVGWVRDELRGGGDRGAGEVLDASICGECAHVREEMLLVLRIAVLCTARSPKDRPSMRDVLTMLGEAKPRRKGSNASGAAAVVAKDKPVFAPVPESEFL